MPNLSLCSELTPENDSASTSSDSEFTTTGVLYVCNVMVSELSLAHARCSHRRDYFVVTL